MDTINTETYRVIITVLLTIVGICVTLVIKLLMMFNKKVATNIDDLKKRMREEEDYSLKFKSAFTLLEEHCNNNHEKKINFDKSLK